MATAAAILTQLRAELGEQARLLQYAPLNKVRTKDLQDPDAISFAILFGYIREHSTQTKREVWVHLYPATRTGGHPEIQFHSNDGDEYCVKHDSDGIAKSVSGCDAAFKLAGRWSKRKLFALSKYYFLEKLVETQTDHEKLSFGIPITETFKAELRTVCREFEEEAQKLVAMQIVALRPTRMSGVANTNNGQDSQSSELSETPSGLSTEDVETPSDGTTMTSKQATKARRGAEGLQASDNNDHNDNARGVSDDVVVALLELGEEEEVIKTETSNVKEKMVVLESKLLEAKEKAHQIDVRKERLFGGMTAVVAFQLGRDVERMREEKRRKLS
ncbi:Nn.00g066020.m01.CDS01 [Neocucurbitaria sp. VM-36]